MSKVEDLQSEIVKNAREDRQRLVQIADGLKSLAEKKTDEGSGELDPEVAMMLSDQLSKVSDSLVKINQQLVELVRIDTRKIPSPQDIAKFNNKERDHLFDDLETRRKTDA